MIDNQKRRRFGAGAKVNPNPRPPNEPRARAKFEANKVKQIQQRIHQRSQKNQQNKPKPTAKPKPTQPGQPTPAFAPPTDPRDEQYWTDYAQLNFNKNMALNAYKTQGIADTTAYEQQLLLRSQDEPLEVQRQREQANVGGMIYSTAHQEDLGQLGKEQFLQQDEIQKAYRDAVSQRALDVGRTEGQYLIDEGQIGLDAKSRAAALELNRPGPVPPDQKYVPPPSQTKKKKPAYPIPHQKDIQRIHGAQKALRKRVGRLKKKRSSSEGAQKKAISKRIKRINKKRKYLSKF